MSPDRFTLVIWAFSFFQISFLHGFVLLEWFTDWRLSLGTTSLLISTFGIGLIANLVLFAVTTLVHQGLGLQTDTLLKFTLYLILLIEVVYFTRASIRDVLVLRTGCIAFLFPLFLVIFGQLRSDALSSIFVCDEIPGYLVWAKAWSMNHFPHYIMFYGQLIPAAWASLIFCLHSPLYLAILIKPLSSLFSIYILLGFWELFQRTNRTAHGLAILLIWLLIAMTTWTRSAIWVNQVSFWRVLFYFNSMNIDLAVTFFGVMAWIFLLMASLKRTWKEARFLVLLGQVFVIGAALTKQAGGFSLITYPFMGMILLRDLDLSRNQKVRLVTLSLIGSLIALAPFVALNEYLTYHKLNSNGNLEDIGRRMSYMGPSALSRFGPALETLAAYCFHPAVVFAYFCLAGWGILLSYQAATGMILLGLPYLCLWALYFSYEVPNLSLALPFIGFSGGYGMEKLLRLPAKTIVGFRSPVGFGSLRMWKLIGVGSVALVLVLSFVFPKNTWVNWQRELNDYYSVRLFQHFPFDYFVQNGRIQMRPRGQ